MENRFVRQEQTEHRFEAIRPFGPTIMAGTLPESLIKLLDDKAQQKDYNNAPPDLFKYETYDDRE